MLSVRTGNKGELLYSKNDLQFQNTRNIVMQVICFVRYHKSDLFSEHVTSCMGNTAAAMHVFRMHFLTSEDTTFVLRKLSQDVKRVFILKRNRSFTSQYYYINIGWYYFSW
jgi:hypothetical protein